MKIESEITDLSEKYYSLISCDYHKDRDCHWTIKSVWSYGSPPKFIVCHDGYVWDRVEIVCDSYDSALRELKNQLKAAYETQLSHMQMSDMPGELRDGFEL